MPICHCVAGVVIEKDTGTPQANLRVRLVTGARGMGDVVAGEVLTDGAGRFSIDITGLTAERTSGVYHLVVFQDLVELEATGNVEWSSATDADDLRICVILPSVCTVYDESPPQEIASQINTDGLHGLARHADGTGLSGLIASLWEVGFSGETLIQGSVTTLAEGWFSFNAVTTPPNRDLYVKVEESGTPNRLVGTSKVVFDYSGGGHRFLARVCDDALRGPSEYSKVTENLSMLIFPGPGPHPVPGLSAALLGMETRAVTWAAGKSTWTLDQIRDRVLAERLDQELTGTGTTVGSEPLYGLLRLGFPRLAKKILARPPRVTSNTLARAQAGNIIGLTVNIETVLDALLEAMGRALDDGGADALGGILRTSQTLSQAQALTDPEIAAFCDLFASFEGSKEDFWDAVEASAPDGLNWSTAKANEAKRLIRLGTLALGHAPTVLAILKVLGTSGAEDVATWSKSTWDGVAGTPAPPGAAGVNPLPRRNHGEPVSSGLSAR